VNKLQLIANLEAIITNFIFLPLNNRPTRSHV